MSFTRTWPQGPNNYRAVAGDGGLEETINVTAVATVEQENRLSFPKKLAYGMGSVFNDLCASMWFTYLVLFFHKVVELGSTYAGLLILIGQVADALATPVIGFLCDKTHVRYGRRKLWHLIGTIMVAVSFFLIWHTCLGCQHSSLGVKIVYFSIPIIVFQFGWASVQISHLSLIPELTSDMHQRVELNAIRYAFTILSNIGVYVAMFLLLLFVQGSPSSQNKHDLNATLINSGDHCSSSATTEEEISPADVWIFTGTALGVITVGLFFSFMFQIGTREPYLAPEERVLQYTEGKKIKWYLWFANPQFYAVAVIYMCTRLMSNIIQAYIPLFLIESLKLDKTSVAIGPLVMFVVGFLMTLLLKVLTRVVGRYMVYFVGIVFIWGSLIWFQFVGVPDSLVWKIAVYGPTVLVGAGVATAAVISLSMVADLIGNATGSAAFVYGLMSFADKLSSGVVIQIIQALHPTNEDACCPQCGSYYRRVLVLAPGTATAVAVVALVMLAILVFLKNQSLQQMPATSTSHDQLSRGSAINSNSPGNERALFLTRSGMI